MRTLRTVDFGMLSSPSLSVTATPTGQVAGDEHAEAGDALAAASLCGILGGVLVALVIGASIPAVVIGSLIGAAVGVVVAYH